MAGGRPEGEASADARVYARAQDVPTTDAEATGPPDTRSEPEAPTGPTRPGTTPGRQASAAAVPARSGPARDLRILVFADLHLDQPFPWASRETGAATRAAQEITFEAICSTAAAEADVLACAGDLYDEDRHHPQTGDLLRSAFERLAPLPILLLPGSADPLGRLSLYEQVKWPPNVHVFREPNLTAHAVAEGVTIWGAAASSGPAAFDGFQAHGEGVHIGLVHTTTPPDLQRTGLQHVVAAARHQPFDSPQVTCPGAAYPVDPDPATPGWVVLLSVLEDGTVTVNRRELPGSAALPPPPRLGLGGLAAFDLTELGEEQTVRGEFVRDMLAAEDLPPRLRRLALLNGLRALDGIPPAAPD